MGKLLAPARAIIQPRVDGKLHDGFFRKREDFRFAALVFHLQAKRFRHVRSGIAAERRVIRANIELMILNERANRGSYVRPRIARAILGLDQAPAPLLCSGGDDEKAQRGERDEVGENALHEMLLRICKSAARERIRERTPNRARQPRASAPDRAEENPCFELSTTIRRSSPIGNRPAPRLCAEGYWLEIGTRRMPNKPCPQTNSCQPEEELQTF